MSLTTFKSPMEVVLNSNDPQKYTLWLKNHPIVLSQKELNLLYLALKPHKRTEYDTDPDTGAVPI